MKKSVAVTVGIVIIAGAWLGGAWYTGKKLEAETTARIALANEQLAQINPEADLLLQQLSYKRGFFSSHGRYAVSVAEKGQDPDLRLEFDAYYQHGPFPLEALSRGRLMPTLAFIHSTLAETDDSEPWFELARAQAPLTSDVLLSYGGDAQFDIRFAPLSMDDDGDVFSFSGADMKGTFHAKHARSTGAIHAPLLSLDVETEQDGRVAMTATDSRMSFDTYKNDFGLQSGDIELRVDRMALRLDEGADLLVEQLAYGGNSTEDDTFMQGQVYLNTGSVTVNDLPFGSQRMTFKAEKLNGQALKALSDAYNQLVSRVGTPHMFEGVDDLLQAGKALLDANPTLALDDFRWITDKGDSTVFMHAEWKAPSDINAPGAMLLAESLKAVRLDVSVNKSMATDLAAKILQVSEGLDAQEAEALAALQFEEIFGAIDMFGLAEAEGDALKSRIEFDGEKITINGEDLPPEILLGLLLAM